jgi:phenylacetate-coenzyme A ligase PaaK-like adenylate-forming protein
MKTFLAPLIVNVQLITRLGLALLLHVSQNRYKVQGTSGSTGLTTVSEVPPIAPGISVRTVHDNLTASGYNRNHHLHSCSDSTYLLVDSTSLHTILRPYVC